jgi:hypothetical protein
MEAGATRLIPGTENWGGYCTRRIAASRMCSFPPFGRPKRLDFGGGETLSSPKMDRLSQEASGLRKGNLAARCSIFCRDL